MTTKGAENMKKVGISALSINPLDVTGAGDSLLAVMATGISSDVELMHMAAVGCCMTTLAGNNGQHTNRNI